MRKIADINYNFAVGLAAVIKIHGQLTVFYFKY